MIQFIYTIHDSKALAFLPPFYLHNKNMAQRSFGDAVNDIETQFNKHPEDYSLWEIGEFDDQTGEIIYYTPHHALGSGLDYINNNVIDINSGERLFPGEAKEEIK